MLDSTMTVMAIVEETSLILCCVQKLLKYGIRLFVLYVGLVFAMLQTHWFSNLTLCLFCRGWYVGVIVL